MKLCNDTITVFNAQFDAENDCDNYFGTVISGVSWYDEIAAKVDNSGLRAVDKYTIRVPADADFGGKTYTDPVTYATSDPAQFFTLKSGDIIVRGNVSAVNPRPATLQKTYSEVAVVLAVTDNRRARHAPHWKVIGG